MQAVFGRSFLPAASVTSPTEVRVRVQGLGFREVYGLRLGVGPQRRGGLGIPGVVAERFVFIPWLQRAQELTDTAGRNFQ